MNIREQLNVGSIGDKTRKRYIEIYEPVEIYQ